MVHAKTYHEIRDDTLPAIHRMSRKIQSIIIKTTEEYHKMQVYKDSINQSCLSTSLILNMTKLSRNLTRIMQKDVPFIEEELRQIVLQMEELQQQVDGLMDSVKQQEVPRLNTQQLQRLQILMNIYQKLNDQLGQIRRQLTQMMDEILRPGLDSVEVYNTCLSSTAQSLMDYSLDQLVENSDDDDHQLFSPDDLLVSNNRTDL